MTKVVPPATSPIRQPPGCLADGSGPLQSAPRGTGALFFPGGSTWAGRGLPLPLSAIDELM